MFFASSSNRVGLALLAHEIMSQETAAPSNTVSTTATASSATTKGLNTDVAVDMASSTTSSGDRPSPEKIASTDANAMAATSTTTSITTMTDTTQAPRGLLDLPLELSSMDYQLVVQSTNGGGRQLLARPPMRTMAMTKVNRQTRSEFLPQFFAETWFIAVVGTNCGAPGNEGAREQAGALAGKEDVLASLRNGGHLGSHASLRAVTLVIIDSDPAAAAYHNLARTWARHSIAQLWVTIGKGCKVSVERLSGSMHPDDFEAVDTQALDRCIEKAEAVAQAIGNRQGFNGLTLEDIETIAEEFRVEAKGASKESEMD